MARREKKPITITTAYRQSNYLIVDNKPTSVTVSVYFRMSNKQILKPNLKAKIRSIKNSVHKYDEGQILVRELTSDTHLLPKKSQLTELVHYLLKYEGLTDIQTFTVLWKRLTDYQTLRHVEKSLLVIEHMLSQKHPFYSHSFEGFCKDRKPEFIKLQNYHYKIDGSDIGQNVTQRATDIYQTLFKPPNISPEYIESPLAINNTLSLPKPKKPHKYKKHSKKKKKKSKRKVMIRDDDDIKHEEANIVQDLLALNVDNFKGANDNINNNNNDIFDIFGELPSYPSYKQNDNNNNSNNVNNYQEFVSSSTSTSGMILNNNIQQDNDYNFPVTF